MSGLEKKFATKSKIVNYIINRESTSKVEISKELNLSMPLEVACYATFGRGKRHTGVE